jgi:hypothetical protein
MTITPELEAVARAIYESDTRAASHAISPISWDDERNEHRPRYRIMARAALMAIREPTVSMHSAVDHSADQKAKTHSISAPAELRDAEIYRAMIDHILGEPK